MLDPGRATRDEWLKRGVAILPYQDHGDVRGFFAELAELARNRAGASKADKPVTAGGRNDEAIHVMAVFEERHKAWKTEEMDGILARELSNLGSSAEKERLLFQLAALSRSGQAIHLCRQLVSMGTPACGELVLKMIWEGARDKDLSVLRPHPLHAPIHQWFIEQRDWRMPSPDGLSHQSLSKLLKWLLESEWASVGVDLWDTFLRILNRLKNGVVRRGLDDLYTAAEHITGACAEIEKVVFAPGFVRADDSQRRWYRAWDEQIVTSIRLKKADKATQRILGDTSLSPAGKLKEANALEAGMHEDYRGHCFRLVVDGLLKDFSDRSILGICSGSSSYNPAKANEIVDALASVREDQVWVLHAIIDRLEKDGGEATRTSEVEDSWRRELFVRLWWRYSSATRLDYGDRHSRQIWPRLYFSTSAGQHYLLQDMMGLQGNDDEHFRKTFNQSLELYRDLENREQYGVYRLMELWRERQLGYEMSDDCPPEIIRRVAVFRGDSQPFEGASKRWAEAKERAEQLWQQRDRRGKYVSAERGDYVIDNLLGAYFPADRRVVLYRKMVEYAAAELGVDQDALLTVVYIHETVHAFSHLGRDLNGNMWADYSIPIGNTPDERPIECHEAIAQFYSFRLLQWLKDKRLMDAFLALEKQCDPVYRAWRRPDSTR